MRLVVSVAKADDTYLNEQFPNEILRQLAPAALYVIMQVAIACVLCHYAELPLQQQQQQQQRYPCRRSHFEEAQAAQAAAPA